MLSATEHIKFCWICGKDVRLEHCRTDEHGLSVHESCHAKRMMMKAASLQNDQWRQAARSKRDAA